MIEPKANEPRVCAKCEHGRHQVCALYLDVVTGHGADLYEARKQCQGHHWEERFIDAYLSGASITTSSATIHRQPPTKTYE